MKRRISNLFIAAIALALIGAIPAMAEGPRVVKMSDPEMEVYLPGSEQSTGKAVVICPGGGYCTHAMSHEGQQFAPFFNDLGYAAVVLKYTLPEGDRNRPMLDVDKCYKIIADSAASWHIDPAKTGIMGSSAGGHLASTMATHPTDNCKPAFQILFYPVISLEKEITHQGTANGFLGNEASDKLRREWSAQNNVTSATPPAFIVLSGDDTVVPPANSILYFSALNKSGVPATMHIYPKGDHGWGYSPALPEHDLMLQELRQWLKNL